MSWRERGGRPSWESKLSTQEGPPIPMVPRIRRTFFSLAGDDRRAESVHQRSKIVPGRPARWMNGQWKPGTACPCWRGRKAERQSSGRSAHWEAGHGNAPGAGGLRHPGLPDFARLASGRYAPPWDRRDTPPSDRIPTVRTIDRCTPLKVIAGLDPAARASTAEGGLPGQGRQ